MIDPDEEPLHLRLNRETARLSWHALLPHFAAGSVIAVDTSLDLIDVAVKLSQDDVAAVRDWMARELLSKVDDARAAQWVEQDPSLWTVVVKPWILVQLDQRRPVPARADA